MAIRQIRGHCTRDGATYAYLVEWVSIPNGYEWKATFKTHGQLTGRRIGTTYAAPGIQPEFLLKTEVELAFQRGMEGTGYSEAIA